MLVLRAKLECDCGCGRTLETVVEAAIQDGRDGPRLSVREPLGDPWRFVLGAGSVEKYAASVVCEGKIRQAWKRRLAELGVPH